MNTEVMSDREGSVDRQEKGSHRSNDSEVSPRSGSESPQRHSRSPKVSARLRSARKTYFQSPDSRVIIGSRLSSDNSPSDRCLGIFGLSIYTRERDLTDVFSKYGPLEDVQIIYDRQSGRSRGFAFVYFKDKSDAAMAKKRCKDIEIDGNKISIDYSHQFFSRLIDQIVVSKSPKPVLRIENGGGDVINKSDPKSDPKEMIKSKVRSYECSECGKSYSKKQYVNDHMLSVHRKSDHNYSCRVCGQTSAWKVTILKHIRRRHPEKNTTQMIDELF